MRVPVFVSMTETRSVLAEATNRRLPERSRRSAEGWRPAGIQVGSERPFDDGVNAATLLPPHADTNTRPSGATTTPYGYLAAHRRRTPVRGATATTARHAASCS